MLYSKNGSIPKPQTDGTEGWIEVEVAPTPGPNEEVVWWYPPGWVVRPFKPDDEAGYAWNWSQSEEKWVKSALLSDASVTPQPDNSTGSNTEITISTSSAGVM